MPKKCEKEKIIEYLIENATNEIILNEEMEIGDDAVEDVLDDLGENLTIVMSCRRGISHTIPKSDSWRNDVLTSLDEDRFRQMLRVGRNQFSKLVDIIKSAEEFNRPHASKQFSIELQLAIVLFRLGSSGESAAFRKIGSIFGVGDGGTISKITNRIFKAFLNLQSKYIFWPNQTDRFQIVADTFDELPFCIGYVDGTEIKIAESPIEDHTSYFSRNHIYSIKAQVVCDYRRLIRHVVVGHPGSWHDARIFRNSSLYQKKEQYFSSQQWIAGDSAYPLSDTLVTPYRNNAKQLDRDARIAFNLQHSKYRVRIEHCFGILKERFGSLKQLRMRLSNKENHKLCCDWFLVCCILHNILIMNNDDLTCFEPNLNQVTAAEDYTDFEEVIAGYGGEIKRQAIYSLLNS